MHELPAFLFAEHRAPRRHRALREADADHVIQLAVGVLRNVQDEIGRFRFERRAGGAVAAAAIAVTGDATLAIDRATSRDRLARRRGRVLELRRGVEAASPVALLGEGPEPRDDRTGGDERGERPPLVTA
jgi:hypothetical protein